MMIDYLDGIAYEVPEECPYCGRKVFEEAIKKGPHIALQCRNCGGWSYAKQCKSNNWNKLVKRRANYRCERCGKTVSGRGAHAHHKVPKWFMPQWEKETEDK